MRHVVLGIAGLLCAAAAAYGRDEADDKIKAFKETVKKCKEVGDYVSAINDLGSLQHPKIKAELKIWLGKPNADIVHAAAENLAKYRKDKEAAEAILKAAVAACNQKDKDPAVKLIGLVGDTECREMAKPLCNLFRHPDTKIAEAAIDAVGRLKSKNAIDALIAVLKEMEGIKDDGGQGQDMPPRDDPNSNNPPSNPNQQNEKLDRKRKLEPAANRSLADITDQSFKTVKDWVTWWQKNKATFKEKD